MFLYHPELEAGKPKITVEINVNSIFSLAYLITIISTLSMRFYFFFFYIFLVYILYLWQIAFQTNHISCAQEPHMASGTVVDGACYRETLVGGL